MILKLVRSEPVSMQQWATYWPRVSPRACVLWWLAARRYNQERLAISA
jgi:hypothetical protein